MKLTLLKTADRRAPLGFSCSARRRVVAFRVGITTTPSASRQRSEVNALLGCDVEVIWLMARSRGIGQPMLSVFSNESVEQQTRRILDFPHLKFASACCDGSPEANDYVRVRPERFRSERDIQSDPLLSLFLRPRRRPTSLPTPGPAGGGFCWVSSPTQRRELGACRKRCRSKDGWNLKAA